MDQPTIFRVRVDYHVLIFCKLVLNRHFVRKYSDDIIHNNSLTTQNNDAGTDGH